uniref:Uncharacterized protein n=1 Tax=Dicentrarchus labrax TaxID=13489 RepID=A0A8P4KT55_DICLA
MPTQLHPAVAGTPQQLHGLLTDPNTDTNAFGPHCEMITKSENVRPCRASWTFKLHPAQEQLLKYVLDTENPAGKLIVKTGKSCLTRADFWGLGLNKEMESTIGNAGFEVIEKIAQSQGKTIFVADLYIVPTWRKPTLCDPLASLPNDASIRDAIVIPVWKPGHFLLSYLCCVVLCCVVLSFHTMLSSNVTNYNYRF